MPVCPCVRASKCRAVNVGVHVHRDAYVRGWVCMCGLCLHACLICTCMHGNNNTGSRYQVISFLPKTLQAPIQFGDFIPNVHLLALAHFDIIVIPAREVGHRCRAGAWPSMEREYKLL